MINIWKNKESYVQYCIYDICSDSLSTVYM